MRTATLVLMLLIATALAGCGGASFSGAWSEINGDAVYIFNTDGHCIFASKALGRNDPDKNTCQWWKTDDNQIAIEIDGYSMTLHANLLPNGELLVRYPNHGLTIGIPNERYSKVN